MSSEDHAPPAPIAARAPRPAARRPSWRVPLAPWRLSRLPLPLRAVTLVLAVFAAGLMLFRPASPAEGPPDPSVAGAARVLDAMNHPSPDRDPLADLPDDFAHLLGYQPVTVRFPDGNLRAIHPRGDCSSPGGATRFDFDAGCKAHDLGYDVLRYADKKGHPLGQDARRGVDDQLGADMHARCSAQRGLEVPICHAVAETYSAGVGFNSWRQRYGPPSFEPMGAWSVGFAVIACLLVARRPGRLAHWWRDRRRPLTRAPVPADAPGAEPRASDATDQDAGAPAHGLPVVAVLFALLGLPLVVVLGWWDSGVARQPGLWLAAWGLQVLPIFFFAGGRSHLAAWRAVRGAGGGSVEFLVGRLAGLLRPVVAFVLVWLLLPAALGLLGGQEEQMDELGWMVARPLWYLGVYLLVTAATPVTAWLHRRLGWAVPFTLIALTVAVDLARLVTDQALLGYPNVLLVGLLVHQLGFCHADGSLSRLSRPTLVATAAAGLGVLVVLAATGAYPRDLGGVPGTSVSGLNPWAVTALALAAWQIPLVLSLREPAARWLTRRRWARGVARLGDTPVSLYLWHLAVVLVGVELLSMLGLNVPWTGPGWLGVLLALLAVLVVVLRRLERDTLPAAAGRIASPHGRVAAVLGLGYAALGIVGFVATGFAAGPHGRTVLFLQVDTMQNLLHLLLGVYLVRTTRAGLSGRWLPWLLTAVASVPPMLLPGVSGAGLALHSTTLAVAVVMALAPRRRVIPGLRPV
ncbi:phospholipase A2 [Streptoalloteichus tenebrarius]|uniref:Phospholipase A2 n=1 Tax=Streptoalloteichus tenebrarius (strain ATCC 17920 / DSM 40477 / JCM 4838 / CBS 697.72 / NBRC 16177 / NCIMB 11028 / NRRL B-12390 / A12253. 1 / ISP 5477) TaxID=1933 RepID=A0ABT1I106_STRSD|nr:phospholipase A2 [Streptoalloteichus tenebrarius]MCP2261464.1 phospholipase A2 [Streptoalloteichus tenebrarius]